MFQTFFKKVEKLDMRRDGRVINLITWKIVSIFRVPIRSYFIISKGPPYFRFLVLYEKKFISLSRCKSKFPKKSAD